MGESIPVEFCEALAEFGLTMASEGGDQVGLDSAVTGLETVAFVFRQLDIQPTAVELVDLWSRTSEVQGAASIDDFAAGMDLHAVQPGSRSHWLAQPSRPAFLSRKLAVVPCRIGIEQARTHEEASSQAGVYVRWEVPGADEAGRAERVFEAAATQRLDVRITTFSRPPQESALTRLSDAIGDVIVWLMEWSDEQIDPDLAVDTAERVMAHVLEAPPSVLAAAIRIWQHSLQSEPEGSGSETLRQLVADVQAALDD